MALSDASTSTGLPAPVASRLAEFCAAGKTGNVQLDIKDGQVVGCKLTEAVRVAAAPHPPK